jgi:hypothetical protein
MNKCWCTFRNSRGSIVLFSSVTSALAQMTGSRFILRPVLDTTTMKSAQRNADGRWWHKVCICWVACLWRFSWLLVTRAFGNRWLPALLRTPTDISCTVQLSRLVHIGSSTQQFTTTLVFTWVITAPLAGGAWKWFFSISWSSLVNERWW